MRIALFSYRSSTVAYRFTNHPTVYVPQDIKGRAGRVNSEEGRDRALRDDEHCMADVHAHIHTHNGRVNLFEIIPDDIASTQRRVCRRTIHFYRGGSPR